MDHCILFYVPPWPSLCGHWERYAPQVHRQQQNLIINNKCKIKIMEQRKGTASEWSDIEEKCSSMEDVHIVTICKASTCRQVLLPVSVHKPGVHVCWHHALDHDGHQEGLPPSPNGKKRLSLQGYSKKWPAALTSQLSRNATSQMVALHS